MDNLGTINSNLPESVVSSDTELSTTSLDKAALDQESLEIINQLIAEKDGAHLKDLTYMFNANQNKKTMIRVNKLNELLDIITDQTMTRFSRRPDEISNQELLQGLKIVQDIAERGQRQVAENIDTPLIQINQQNNEINLGNNTELSTESRDRVRQAVLAILAGVNQPPISSEDPDIIEVVDEQNTEE